jgi:3-isopropylmalate/(R)-2-methylmalate dehydratase small subunit
VLTLTLSAVDIDLLSQVGNPTSNHITVDLQQQRIQAGKQPSPLPWMN